MLHYIQYFYPSIKKKQMIKNFTKKLFIAGAIFLSANTLSAQLVYETFDYTGLLNANGWTTHSGIGSNAIATTTGLTYTDYNGSGTGNAALVNNLGGEDLNIRFTPQSTDGQNIYVSCLVNITDPAATKPGDYFISIGNNTSADGKTFTSFTARVFAKITATGVNFGISNSSTATYGLTNFVKNTTYLLILKYTIQSGTTSNPVSLWILPAGVPATEAAAGTAEVTVSSASLNIINAIALRQGTTSSPQTVVDGIKVGTTWANSVLPIKLEYFKAQKQNNSNTINWKVTSTSTNIAMEVERSADAKNYKSVNAITATQARCNLPFDFIDAQPLQGNNFYRLKMIDIDGKISYSPTVLILNGGKAFQLVGLYPTAVKNETVVSISSEKATVIESRITDMNGKTVKSFKQAVASGSSLITVDCNNLVAGIYNYTGITADGATKTIRFVKL